MNTRFAPESEIDKSTVLGAKPFKHIEKIIDNVLPHAERGIIARGEIIHYCSGDTRQCFLLLHGSVALHRRGDGIVLNSESAPFILGVSSQLSSEHLYVRALKPQRWPAFRWRVSIMLSHNRIYGSTSQTC